MHHYFFFKNATQRAHHQLKKELDRVPITTPRSGYNATEWLRQQEKLRGI